MCFFKSIKVNYKKWSIRQYIKEKNILENQNSLSLEGKYYEWLMENFVKF